MLKRNPFLHIDHDRVYNPLSDRTLLSGEERYAHFQDFVAGSPADEALVREGWVIKPEDDLSTQYRLKIVSLETMTTCNQKCYFCPVSIAPREDYAMPQEMFDRLLGELTAYRGTLEGVFLQSYNEPTIDRRFVDHVRALFEHQLPVAVLSNGTGLTPAKIDVIMAAGQLSYLCINLSTLDGERYEHDRGEDHLAAVLRNLDSLKDRPFAREMKIVVLGTGDDVHTGDFEAIQARFAGSRFNVERHIVMDRAGWLAVGTKPQERRKQLAGCDNVGSRPLQHLHITPQGKCVLCCEDYDEKYVVGDLTQNTIAEVLSGAEIAKMRRWVYGLEEAPDDFMCRGCIYSRV
ncbi:MAG: radical SAM protein [Acidobacteriota bacterium]|nr:radical SAM protein [Acidobacteriota bacterium]